MNIRTDIRPRAFSELVAPSKDMVALQKRCETVGVPQTVLLHGPTGCGKTTAARIMAEMLRQVYDVDLIERNAADLNGVDAARQLAQLASVRPLHGVRVFILDECQRLSKDAQDVLLIPTEEPPPWVYWFFCTTEPSKISKTLTGRCYRVEVSELPSVSAIAALVKHALWALKLKPDEAKLKRLAEELSAKGITAPRAVLGAVEAWAASGKIEKLDDGTGIAAFDAVRAYYAGNADKVLAYFAEADTNAIVSWQFIAANYGTSVLKSAGGATRARTAALVLNITEGYPEEAVLRAAWLAARVARGVK